MSMNTRLNQQIHPRWIPGPTENKKWNLSPSNGYPDIVTLVSDGVSSSALFTGPIELVQKAILERSGITYRSSIWMLDGGVIWSGGWCHCPGNKIKHGKWRWHRVNNIWLVNEGQYDKLLLVVEKEENDWMVIKLITKLFRYCSLFICSLRSKLLRSMGLKWSHC